MSDEIKRSVMSATALKFFPGWTVQTGVLPEPWVTLSDGKLMLEVHVPKSVPLDEFEEATWWQFKKLQDAFVEDRAGGTPID